MSMEMTTELLDNLFGFPEKEKDSEVDNTLIFEEITRELEEYLLRESDDADSTGGTLEALTTISEQVQEEFDELLGEDTNKKQFLKSLSKIFALLLNTKVTTAEKIKKSLKSPLKQPSKYDQDKINCKLLDVPETSKNNRSRA